MVDTRANRFGGGAGCWAGRASIPTANWWRREGLGEAVVRAVQSAGRASLPTPLPTGGGGAERGGGAGSRGGPHTLDHGLDILPYM